MVEAGANEIPEAEILDALDIAHGEIKKLCAAAARAAEQGRQAEARGRRPRRSTQDLLEQIQESHGAALDEATSVEDKLDRQDATKAVEEEVLAQYAGDPDAEGYAESRAEAQQRLRQAREDDHPRAHRRPEDAPGRPRGRRDPRRSTIEVGLLPRTHGSALFTRGQTQALSVAALGTHARGDAARHARARDVEALLPPLQLPAVLGRARPASCAAPSAVTSATARSPSARSCR